MKPSKIILHHSGGVDANPLQDSSNYTVEQCNLDHKARFDFISSMGSYVGYQYFLDKQGIVTQCRKDDEEGAHTIGQNKSSIGICMAGNFDLTLPTMSQEMSLRSLLKRKVKEWNIPENMILPHRIYAKKTCYGRNLSDTWGQKLIKDNTIIAPIMSNTEMQTSLKKAKDFLLELLRKLVSR